jgi:hypothetical protein
MKRFIGSCSLQTPNNIVKWWYGESEELYTKFLKTQDPFLPEDFKINPNLSYNFNSLGYRGEEFNPNAKMKIYTAGCSLTFGTGVHNEQTWPNVFTKLFSNLYSDKYCTDDFSLLNISMSGASNDAISRLLITQVNNIKPDLLIVNFTASARKEHVRDGEIMRITAHSSGPVGTSPAEVAYHNFYTPEDGFINAIRNILLIQYLCKFMNIPYIFTWWDHQLLDDPDLVNLPICSDLLECIDHTRLVKISIDDTDIRMDLARDCAHPGPQSHRQFAKLVLEHFNKLYRF